MNSAFLIWLFLPYARKDRTLHNLWTFFFYLHEIYARIIAMLIYFFHFVILFDRFFWKLLREVVEGRDHHCRHFVTWLRSLHKKEIITHLSQIVPQFWSCQVISQIGVKQCVVLTASQLSWCFARTKGAISLSRSRSRSHIKFES